MATVSERSKQFAEQWRTNMRTGVEVSLESFIEQALLAERRLALEEAAKIVDAGATCFAEFDRDECFHDSAICPDIQEIAEKVRAAAEKEAL